MRRRMSKILKFSLSITLIMILLALFFPTWTSNIEGEQSISELGQVEINGAGHEI